MPERRVLTLSERCAVSNALGEACDNIDRLLRRIVNSHSLATSMLQEWEKIQALRTAIDDAETIVLEGKRHG